ncbi:PepSY-associated TM helix domain-containing protein [Pedobacter antarcticus]|uniref:PepSY-associated TM helix domain-containing protein n=1 Tax=Pedobacter antarcticus TaxID=34086 RepID=UPI00292F06CF|nr:PepSY-associated TM helix domain-containing protein [Pedobacter antarcticus]
MKKETAWAKIRKFLTDIHLWLGLGSGIIVLVVCLTGTIYVFNTEIREAATPELFKINPNGLEAKAPEELIAVVEKSSEGKVVAMRMPADQHRSWQFSVRKKEEKKEKSKEAAAPVDKQVKAGKKDGGQGGSAKAKGPAKSSRPVTYYVNPYTAEVLGNSGVIKSATVDFMGYMFSLHRWLLLDKIEEPIFEGLENRKLGSYITGIATILFTVGVLTGMAIWFPKKIKSWKQGLKIKWSGSWKRTNHDLHNTLGFYSCIFLFLMGVTGPLFSFDWYRDGLRKTLGTYQSPDAPAAKALVSDFGQASSQKLSIADYSAAASQILNYHGDLHLSFPADSAATVAVTKYKNGFFAPAAGDKLALDQYSGKILEISKFSEMPFNERVSGSLKALHLGDVYGTFTKLIYFLACLIATSLPVTGTLIWLNKMKKKKKKPLVKLSVQPVV